MPRVPDTWTSAIAYLYATEDDARAGNATGGSGFLVGAERDGCNIVYAVTNYHVVRNGNLTVRLNNRTGGFEVLPTTGADWTAHPDGDDIAVAQLPYDGDVPLDASPFALEDISSSLERLASLEMGIGDEVVMIGRFSGHSGRGRNEPVARFGNIARMAGGELIRDGRDELVDAYLVDMRSQAGYSGSPVFAAPAPIRGDGSLQLGPPRFGFLGIDTGHKLITVPVRDRMTGDKTDHLVEVNSGIAVVAPYYKIADLLNEPELVARREQIYQKWAEHHVDSEDGSSGD